jgi:hypothetical protein
VFETALRAVFQALSFFPLWWKVVGGLYGGMKFGQWLVFNLAELFRGTRLMIEEWRALTHAIAPNGWHDLSVTFLLACRRALHLQRQQPLRRPRQLRHRRQEQPLVSQAPVAPAAIAMTSQGTAHGRFERAIHRGHVQAAEMAAREMGGLSLADGLLLCELLAKADPARYERAALRWLERFIEERLPPLIEVVLAASALADLRHGQRNAGVETLKQLAHQG